MRYVLWLYYYDDIFQPYKIIFLNESNLYLL